MFSFPFFWRCMNSYLEFFGCKCLLGDNKLVQKKYNIPKQMYYMKPYRITNFLSVLRTKPYGQSFTSLNLMPIFSNPISPIWKEFQPICRPARLKESSWNNQGFHIHVLVINRSSAGSYHTILSSFFFPCDATQRVRLSEQHGKRAYVFGYIFFASCNQSMYHDPPSSI